MNPRAAAGPRQTHEAVYPSSREGWRCAPDCARRCARTRRLHATAATRACAGSRGQAVTGDPPRRRVGRRPSSDLPSTAPCYWTGPLALATHPASSRSSRSQAASASGMASNAATSAASAIVSTGNQSRMARTGSWAGVRVGTTSDLPRPGGPAPAAALCACAESRHGPACCWSASSLCSTGQWGSGVGAADGPGCLRLSASSTFASVRASPQSPPPRSA